MGARQHPPERRLREGRATGLPRPHVVDAGTHQRLHGDHPDAFRARPLDDPAELGLERHEVEPRAQLLVEAHVLREVVCDEDDVREVVVERVIEALHEGAAVTGHPAKANLAVADRPFGELRPLRILQPAHVVDGVIEVDVDVVRAQPSQRPFQGRHHLPAPLAAPRLVLRGDDVAVALALERLADGLLRPAATVALGGVEVRDPTGRGVANEARVRGTAGAERDVRDLEAGVPEGNVALDARRRGPARRRPESRQRRRHAGPRAEKSPPVHDHAPYRRRVRRWVRRRACIVTPPTSWRIPRTGWRPGRWSGAVPESARRSSGSTRTRRRRGA